MSSAARRGVTAEALIRLLAERHSDDVFVPECKDGPHTSGVSRMDAWAMRKSWAHPAFIGYEVKVSRQDWLNDKKWMDYIPCVNEMWLVAPMGVVEESELPNGVGLLRPSTNGSRLFVKRKAIWERGDPERQMMVAQYVLMSRTKITREYHTDKGFKLRMWMEGKENASSVGHLISKTLRRRIDEEIEAVQRESREQKQLTSRVMAIIEGCNRIGINLESYYTASTGVESIAKKLQGEEARETAAQALRHMQRVANDATEAAKKLAKALGEELEDEEDGWMFNRRKAKP